jgi:hypothetical protein
MTVSSKGNRKPPPPIKKGEVRNPTGTNGRTRDAIELHAQIAEYLSECESHEADGNSTTAPRSQWLVAMMYHRAMGGSVPHMNELLNRWVGKPKETIAATIDTPNTWLDLFRLAKADEAK